MGSKVYNSHIIHASAHSYAINKWADQDYRIEVWVEKDALVGVIGSACSTLDVDYFSCRGYTSSSEMWIASQRLQDYASRGQTPIILHFGDHDPSGKDMTRDITDRLELFMGGLQVDRLALNMDQIREYQPPPNPAKITDSRAAAYILEYGYDSWELDALEPAVLVELITSHVINLRDEKKWKAALAREASERRVLTAASEHWQPLSAYIAQKYLTPKPPKKRHAPAPAKRKKTSRKK